MTFRLIALIGWFFLCLYPVSVDGIGVNYAFVLLPLLSITLRGRLQHPGDSLMLVIIIFVGIFFCATLYQYDLIGESARRLISFAIFISIFSYTFVRIDDEMIAAFKSAVVVSSTYFSLISVYVLLSAGAANVGYAAKDLVGTQRIGFVYVLALWLTYLDPDVRKTLGMVRYGCTLAITAGLLLTFSRASVVAALGSLALFAISQAGRWIQRLGLRALLNAVASAAGIAVIIGIVYWLFPLAFSFFGEHLFGFLANSEEVQAHVMDPNSSEGTRVLLLEAITEFVSRNPLTGAGYLGVWVLPGLPVGSAHNQYLDVLFRTGVLGLLAYGFVLIALMRHLAREQKGLFWGVLGVLIYGLFHETFKESHGAGILAFLIGLLAQSSRDRREAVRSSCAPATGPPDLQLAAGRDQAITP